MKHKSPKQLRKKKRGQYDMIIAKTEVKESRADRLPSFDKYNPNRIHVARRRQAYKDHYSFPRGWILRIRPAGEDQTMGLLKHNNTTWYINGVNVS